MAKDLLDNLDLQGLHCLNESSAHPWANALKQGYREDDGLYLESDADEQLLVNIPFQQKSKLSSLLITGPSDGTGPKRVKLYVNLPSFGFSDAEGSVPAAQEFDLTPAQLAGEAIPLKFVKFQSVTQLSVFIESNQGGEETTKVTKIALMGQTGEGDKFNVAEIKKVEDGH
ncbi:hypothetical protein FOA52_014923 [Chlamydomonas sp. UWO 241]|nr:hypothetical protein FOA52_014923 [Chlamydomonas sp. UWO 241]